MAKAAEGKHSDIFGELDKYSTIIAYSDGNDDLTVFEKNAGYNKTYVDLRVSDELKAKFIEHYSVEKLPCMIKFGCNIYLDEHSDKMLLEAKKREDLHYMRMTSDLIGSARVFIFIKGRASAPKCKFTRQLLGILEEQGLVYERDFLDFDVLLDHVLRERLKTLHNWPTFPQVFVQGKFIGGLNALKVAVENGIFHNMLNNKDT